MRTPYPTFGSGRGFRHPGPRYCSPQRASVRQEVFSAPILEASAPQPCSSTLCDCRAQSPKRGPTTVLTTTRPEPGESTRQTSGDGRRNPGAAAVGLSSRFRQSELSHQQCPARSGAQVPAPELVQVGYLPADFGQQDWSRVSRQKRLTVSARQTAMPFRSLCPLRTKSSSCRQ